MDAIYISSDFIAITASKHFKCNTFIAVLCCCALVNPDWAGMAARIADGEVIRFWESNCLRQPILQQYCLHYFWSGYCPIWNDFRKETARSSKSIANTVNLLLIMVPATILVIGPVSSITANGIANGYNFLQIPRQPWQEPSSEACGKW